MAKKVDLRQIEKQNAAKKAIKYVKNGMIVGLGTGSTANIFIKLLSEKIKKEKLDITAICTSKQTKKLAEKHGIKTKEFNQVKSIDLAVDGADEIDPKRNLTKGHGGALAWEKCIDYRAKKFVAIMDSSKIKKFLGTTYIPIEVLPFCWKWVKRELENIKGTAKKRSSFKTDSGNYIIEWTPGKISNPEKMEKQLSSIPGIVETGLFTKRKGTAIIGIKNKTKTLK